MKSVRLYLCLFFISYMSFGSFGAGISFEDFESVQANTRRNLSYWLSAKETPSENLFRQTVASFLLVPGSTAEIQCLTKLNKKSHVDLLSKRFLTIYNSDPMEDEWADSYGVDKWFVDHSFLENIEKKRGNQCKHGNKIYFDPQGKVVALQLGTFSEDDDVEILKDLIDPKKRAFRYLEILWVEYPLLSGHIPSEVASLNSLKKLILYNSHISGLIPSELGELQNLSSLSLTFNSLVGSIPKSLGNLRNLRKISLSRNKLEGPIPSEFWKLINLRIMSLSANKFSGPIPTEIENLTNLGEMYLHRNRFRGPIPSVIGNLRNLRKVNLNENKFSGSIPTEIGNLSHLKELFLESNSIQGELPTEIGRLSELRELNISSTSLRGPYPREMVGMIRLRVLHVDSTHLEGNIPAGLDRVIVNG